MINNLFAIFCFVLYDVCIGPTMLELLYYLKSLIFMGITAVSQLLYFQELSFLGYS